MKGILLNEERDLDVSIRRDQLGLISSGLRTGACENQVTELVLIANRGEFKEVPLIGGELDRMRNSSSDLFYAGRLKEMLAAMLIETGRIECTETGINIEVISDETA